MCAASMAFIENSITAKKAGKQFKHGYFLRHWLLQTPGGEITKRRKTLEYIP